MKTFFLTAATETVKYEVKEGPVRYGQPTAHVTRYTTSGTIQGLFMATGLEHTRTILSQEGDLLRTIVDADCADCDTYAKRMLWQAIWSALSAR